MVEGFVLDVQKNAALSFAACLSGLQTTPGALIHPEDFVRVTVLVVSQESVHVFNAINSDTYRSLAEVLFHWDHRKSQESLRLLQIPM